MRAAGLALVGWIVPGGAYLASRRYWSFAMYAVAVWAAFGAGLALHGVLAWPTASDLAGVDGGTSLIFRAAAAVKALAGAPYLLAQAAGISGTFLEGRVHEQGTMLLAMAGVINTYAIGSALDSREEAR
jgi:Family of unknown function (DUF6677)